MGKIILEAAAKHLTPCILELGGKSPCIVDRTANLEHAAHRLVWSTFLNAGQTCVRPDFLLVHEAVHVQSPVHCMMGRQKPLVSINHAAQSVALSQYASHSEAVMAPRFSFELVVEHTPPQ